MTGGTVQVEVSISNARITFLGDNFMVRTGTEDFRTDVGSKNPFSSGTAINLGGVWHPTDTRGGEAIFNGVHYPELYFGFSTSGGTFVTPSVTPTGLGEQILTVPFTFSGFVTAWATPNPEPEDVPVFQGEPLRRGNGYGRVFRVASTGRIPRFLQPDVFARRRLPASVRVLAWGSTNTRAGNDDAARDGCHRAARPAVSKARRDDASDE
jgi:hypothetical protein